MRAGPAATAPLTASGPSLILVHGTRLTGAAWAPQVALLGQRRRVVTPDLPGHGTRAAEPFTLAAASAAIEAVAEAEREATGRRPILVGLSLGGYVAMDLLARRPDLAAGLVIAGASAEPAGILALPLRLFEAALDRVDERIQRRVNAWYFRRRYPAAIADPIIAGGFWTAGGAAALRALNGQRFAPRLAAFDGPTLILNGAWDPFFRWGAPGFAAAARDARRVRLAGAAHLSNLDRPEAFSAAVERFAAGLDDRSTEGPPPASSGVGGRLRGTPDAS